MGYFLTKLHKTKWNISKGVSLIWGTSHINRCSDYENTIDIGIRNQVGTWFWVQTTDTNCSKKIIGYDLFEVTVISRGKKWL